MARHATARKHHAIHRAAKHRPSTLAKVGALLAAPVPDVELLIGAMANPDSGIKFVLGIARKAGRRISEVQSVIFDKLKWTGDAAKTWLQEHGFTGSGKDEGATFWRFRQQSPGKYKEFRTIVPGTRPNPQPAHQSDAYRAGRSKLRYAAAQHGTVNLTPSIADREEWGYAWGDFMRGWNDEARAKVNPTPGFYPQDLGPIHIVGWADVDPPHKQLFRTFVNSPSAGTSIDQARKVYRLMSSHGVKVFMGGGSGEVYDVSGLSEAEAQNLLDSFIRQIRRQNPAPDVADAITSYDEHLGMTTRPEFQEATPDEQAAAMTAQDLCEAYENPAPDWPEEWKSKVDVLLKDWHEAGRARFEHDAPNLNYDTYYPHTVKYKQRWAMLDEGTSGAFMLDRGTGNIYRIKSAYGVPNYKKLIGHISTVTGQGLLMRRRNPEDDLGSGERFAALESKLAARPGVEDPGALAAWIGRRKYGTKRFQRIAAKARRAGNPPRDERVITYDAKGRAVEVRLTTKHSASSYGLPVAVIRGRAYGPGDQPFGKPLYVEVPSPALHPGGTISSDPNQPARRGTLHSRLEKKVRFPETDNAVNSWNSLVGRGRSNPESDAAALYEDFHGKPPGETLEIVTEKREHEWLTQLGLLVELKVATLTNLEATISFTKGAPNLCSSEDGQQLYIEGGDQELDLKALKMDGEKWLKDSMAIGVLTSLVYQTEKGFQNFKLTDYEHQLGEESGRQPFLLYDPINKLLSISGGAYRVEDPGIID